MAAARFLSTKVGEVMTRNVICLSPDMTATEVARIIAERGVEGFPVVSEGKPIGIVTGWDLLTKVVARGVDPNTVRVRDFMTESPITCSPDDSILEVAKLMAKHGVKRVPVVKDGRIIGILTPYDILIYRRITEHADLGH